jgi:molybdopterin-containing oxidoreductase family iron-sulfur binding subunit
VNPSQTELGRMVLNPDVTVRARGVMEKCTFCVQSIQSSKLQAKKESRNIKDGEVKTACQKACPSTTKLAAQSGSPRGSKWIAH